MKSVLVVVAALVPAVASADSLRVATATYDDAPFEPPGMAPVVVVEDAPPAPPPVSTIAAQSSIVGSQRNLLSGTALTVPKGQVELAARSATLLNGASIAGGLTSTTEVWADVYTVIEEEGSIYGVGLKQVLARGDNWQLAVTGSIRGADEEDDKLVTVGGVVTACTERCTVMASGGVSLLMFEDEEYLPVYSGAISVGSPTVRLIGEAMFVPDENDDKLGLGFLGVRFGSRKFAADLGLATLLDADEAVLPMLSLAGRM
jgi:hypothetical protein